jgi:hypothetical protein
MAIRKFTRMLALLGLLLVLVSCGGGGSGDPVESSAPPEVLPVYLMLGQSNMVGNKADPALLPEHLREVQADTLIYKGDWLELAPGVAQDIGFGPEISFAHELRQVIGIIKVAGGGTTLAENWNPNGNLYAKAIQTIRKAARSRPIKIRAILWMQGESDGKTKAHADAYKTNLEETVASLRRSVGHVPFVLCRVNSPLSRYPYTETVRQAQMTANIPDYRWMDCDGLTTVDDGIHFDAASQVQLGLMFADAVR